MVLIRNSRTTHVEGNGSRRRIPAPLLGRPKAGVDGQARSPRYRAVTRLSIAQWPRWHAVDPALREAVEIVSLVLPFRTNEYVVNELINWDRVPDDPMFQLTFPQRRMLDDETTSITKQSGVSSGRAPTAPGSPRRQIGSGTL
jgi:hypothetical protein